MAIGGVAFFFFWSTGAAPVAPAPPVCIRGLRASHAGVWVEPMAMARVCFGHVEPAAGLRLAEPEAC